MNSDSSSGREIAHRVLAPLSCLGGLVFDLVSALAIFGVHSFPVRLSIPVLIRAEPENLAEMLRDGHLPGYDIVLPAPEICNLLGLGEERFALAQPLFRCPPFRDVLRHPANPHHAPRLV